MPIRDQIMNSIHDAMRNKDETRLRVLRLLLGEIKLKDAEKGIKTEDSAILLLVQKEIKIREDSISDNKTAGKSEQISILNQEISILQGYLPKQLSKEELTDLTKKVINSLNASGPADMGKVMKALLPEVQGKASNSEISQVVRTLLETIKQ